MGFHSYMTSEGQSISNVYSSRGALPVTIVMPPHVRLYSEGIDGKRVYFDRFTCTDYEGYGVFNGVDLYNLCGMIGSELTEIDLNALLESDRDSDYFGIGYELIQSRNEHLPRFTSDPNAQWTDLKPIEDCRAQGFFY